MNTVKIHREKTGLFSQLANQLVYDQTSLKEFIQNEFDKNAFENQILLKNENYSSENRKVLSTVLNEKYAQFTKSNLQAKNLELLNKENTFTITTGHQLSLLTGPLYFVIKILHAVKLANELSIEYPNFNFVPIFWMASEDHDFEEINQVNLFNQKFSWNTNQNGAVGRFTLGNWSEFIGSIQSLFSNHPQSEIQNALDSYSGNNLGEATFKLVNSLFAQEGILVLDGDDKNLKTLFVPIIEKELTERKAFEAVEKTNVQLAKNQISTQAFPREINLFLLENGNRERIQMANGVFFTDSGTRFSEEEIIEAVRNHPEYFSPNVILRPIYQECILPNLCYLGGGGEMAYWLQLKGVFETYNVVYPLIQVRNSMMIIDKATQLKMENVGWKTENLFEDVDTLKKQYVLANANDLDMKSIRAKQNELIETCQNVAANVDATLSGYLEAEMTRFVKQMDTLEQKLIRAEKAKHDKALKQMDQVKDKLFPNNGLQERTTNFFNFCADGQVQSHLSKIKSAIEPFEKDFIVLYL